MNLNPSSGKPPPTSSSTRCAAARKPLQRIRPDRRLGPANKRYDKLRSNGALLPMSVEAVSTPNTHPDPRGRRLESWKEIAAYLGRDVTTVRRWERREGLPVHRHVHDKGGSVYAFSSELDAWLHSRKLRLEEEDEGDKAETPVDAESDHKPKGTPQARLWLVVAGMAVLALLSVTYVLIRSHAGNSRQAKISSLAVLPLKNLSGD